MADRKIRKTSRVKDPVESSKSSDEDLDGSDTDKAKKKKSDPNKKHGHHREDRHRHGNNGSTTKTHEKPFKVEQLKSPGRPVDVELIEGSFEFKGDIEFKGSANEYSVIGPSIEIPATFNGSNKLDKDHGLEVVLDISLIGGCDTQCTGIQFVIIQDNNPLNKGALISTSNGRFVLMYNPTIRIPLNKAVKINIGWKSIGGKSYIKTESSPLTDSGTIWYSVKGVTYK
jgi:hypothetical protein